MIGIIDYGLGNINAFSNILKTLDLTRMEKKPLDGTEYPTQSVTDVEQSIGTIEPLPSPQHLEVKQRDTQKDRNMSLQVQLPFTKYAFENDRGNKISSDFK